MGLETPAELLKQAQECLPSEGSIVPPSEASQAVIAYTLLAIGLMIKEAYDEDQAERMAKATAAGGADASAPAETAEKPPSAETGG